MQSESSHARIVVVYQRVSTTEQDIARQEVQLDHARRDYPDREIVVIQDDGVSAFKVPIFDREGGKRLCTLVEAGSVEAVYTDAQDRLSRGSDLEWVTFRTSCETHETRIVVDGREVRNDLGGRVETYLKALFARQESVEKSHRVKGGKRVSVMRDGRRNGGPRPYGYAQADRALTPIEAEFEVLRRIRVMVVEDALPLAEIARRLNGEGVRTVRGAAWSQTRLSQTLANPLYAGFVRYYDEVVPGSHEPVFTQDEWDELQQVLETRRRSNGGRGRPTAGSHVLVGKMLRCECGATVVPRTTTNAQGRVYELYRCLGALSGSTPCREGSVRRELIDGSLEAYFARAGLSDIEEARRTFAARMDRDLEHVRALHAAACRRASETTANLDRIRADYRGGAITAADWQEFRGELDAEHTQALAEIERFAAREAELSRERETVDEEEGALRYLADVRQALTAPIRDAATLDAIRQRLTLVYDHFVLRSTHELEDAGMGSAPADVAGGHVLVPVLREDAIDRLLAERT